MSLFGYDNPTINSSIVIYDSNCSHKPRGTSKPIFSSPKGYFPSITSIRNYRIVTHNFTNNDLTNGKPPRYQSLVNIPPAPLLSPLRPVTEYTPVPATRTLSSVPVLPAEPAPFSLSPLKTALSQRENFPLPRFRSKVGVRPRTFPFLASIDGSFRRSAHSKYLTSGRARCGRR